VSPLSSGRGPINPNPSANFGSRNREEHMKKGTKRLVGLVAVVSLLMTIFTGIVVSASSGTVNADQVNFRAKPSTSSRIIKTMNKGAKITLISKTGNWYKTKIRGKVGYIYSTFVKKTVVKLKTASVVVSVANVRKSNNTKSKILTKIKNGDKVTILSSKGDWYKIKTKSKKTGYVVKSFLRVNSTVTRGEADRPSSNPTKGQQVVDYAKQFIGIRYNYAHESPSEGFDCSGLVWYAYKHFGVSINRSSHDIVNDGTYVSRNDLKVGDIILFRRSGHIFHAALYIGGNKILQAEPSDGVNIDVLFDGGFYEQHYAMARRIYN